MPTRSAERNGRVPTQRILTAAVVPTAAAIIGLFFLAAERTGRHLPHGLAAMVFGLLTVYAAFQGGAAGGLICGMISWIFLAILLSDPHTFFLFTPDDRLILVLMSLALPAVTLLIHALTSRMARDNARLRDAEQMWRLLSEHVPDVVMTVRRDGTIHYVNRPLPWIGMSKGSVVGRPFIEVLPPEYRGQAKKTLPRVFTSGKESSAELRIPSGSGGAPSLYELRIGPVRRDGETFAVLAVFTDVTRRLAEEESHERLVAIVHASQAAIFGTTADGTITSWNHGARKVYGYAPSEIIGKNLSALFPDGLAGAEAAKLIERASKGEHIENLETANRKQDGSRLDVAMTVSPIGERGKIAGLAVIARDLTSRRQADEERRKSLELLAEAERIAHVGSWEWDLASDAMTWTDELFRIYGLEPGAEKPSLAVYLRQIDTEDREKVKQAVKKARAEAVPFSFDHRITRPDGEPRILRAHGAVQRDTAGKPGRLIVTVHDVTSFRRMETELRSKGHDLEHEVRRRTDVLRSTEFRLKTVLDEAPLILWATDKDGILTLSEGRGLAGLGIDPGSHVGMSVFELYKNEPAIVDNHRRALKGATVRGTLLLKGRSLEVTNLPLKSRDGSVSGVIGVAVDVTGRKFSPEKKNVPPPKID
ncbi:MAG TPA: PAS domain S-box protein [Candidatus Eisenbacteria bacterium]|nr:PAS domain S-box protein [Candidatus Eisenbacteria bacterium]